MFCTTKYLFYLSLPSRLVCSLATLPVQVQVPARACWGRQHPAGWDGAVRKEQTPGQRCTATSSQDCAPKSRLSGGHFIDPRMQPSGSCIPHLTVTLVSPPQSPQTHWPCTRHCSWILWTLEVGPLYQDTLYWPGRSPGFKGKSHLHPVMFIVLVFCVDLVAYRQLTFCYVVMK